MSDATTTGLDQLIEPLKPLLRYINPHRFVWLLAVVCAVIAWNRGLALLYALVACLLSLLLLSHALCRWHVRGVTVARSWPDMAHAGVPFDVRYRLTSSGVRHFVSVHEMLDAEMAAGGAMQLSPVFVAQLNREADVVGECRINQRGVYALNELALRSAYPFGLVTHTRTQATEPHQVFVLPAMFDVAQLPFGLAVHQGHGALSSQKQGAHDEFAGLREYRRGDPSKIIHWGATARQIAMNQPWQVKTFETFDHPNMLLVFNQEDFSEASFECMMSVAASIMRHACWVGHPLAYVHRLDGRFCDGWVTPHSAHVHQDMRPLCAMQPQPGAYAEVLAHALQRHPHANLVVTFGRQSISLADDRRAHLHVVLDGHMTQATRQQKGRQTIIKINPYTQGLDDLAKVFS